MDSDNIYEQNNKQIKKCCYCKKQEIATKGFISSSIIREYEGGVQEGIYFCSITCAAMTKHEEGFCKMDEKLYETYYNKFYKKLKNRREKEKRYREKYGNYI